MGIDDIRIAHLVHAERDIALGGLRIERKTRVRFDERTFEEAQGAHTCAARRRRFDLPHPTVSFVDEAFEKAQIGRARFCVGAGAISEDFRAKKAFFRQFEELIPIRDFRSSTVTTHFVARMTRDFENAFERIAVIVGAGGDDATAENPEKTAKKNELLGANHRSS